MPGFRATLDEWKRGQLHSGSKTGPVVTSQKQALAIAYKQAGEPRSGLSLAKAKLRGR